MAQPSFPDHPRGVTPAAAARQIDLGTKLLVGYAVAAAAVMVAVGALTSGPHTFARTAAGLVLAGWVLLGAVGTVHRRMRRALIRQHPDLAAALARRPVPGSGWAAFVYVPLLLACVSMGSLAIAIAHPPSGMIGQGAAVFFFLVVCAKAEPWYDRRVRAPYLALLHSAAQKPVLS